jgi:hypothetical protein
METQKNYPEVKQFLDSIGEQFREFNSKRTDVRSSQSNTMFIIDQITKQNEKKKREQLTYKYDVMSAIDDINLTTDEKIKILLLLTSIK